MIVHCNIIAAGTSVQVGTSAAGGVDGNSGIPAGTVEIGVSFFDAWRQSFSVRGVNGCHAVDGRAVVAIIGGIQKNVFAACAFVQVDSAVGIKLWRICAVGAAVGFPPGYGFTVDGCRDGVVGFIVTPFTRFNTNGFTCVCRSRIVGQRVAEIDIGTAGVFVQILIDPRCVMRIVVNRIVGIRECAAAGKTRRLALALCVAFGTVIGQLKVFHKFCAGRVIILRAVRLWERNVIVDRSIITAVHVNMRMIQTALVFKITGFDLNAVVVGAAVRGITARRHIDPRTYILSVVFRPRRSLDG